ncbi:MAG: MFS transporter, partial [Alphaproteobacteria bacterium]|nr:MFS transporter [Alphaproteobacteria bacterium]
IAGLVIAIASPVLGAIADNGGPRKPWIAATAALTVAATMLLWFTRPEPGWLGYGLVVAVIGTIAFEIGTVFYNAMLPDLVPPHRLGRVSGWAWGLGYGGGLACLLVSLFVLIQPDPAPFGLDRAAAEHVRATNILAGLWFAAFALPLFLFVPDRPASGLTAGQAVRQGLAAMLALLPELRHRPAVARFLLSRLFYTDGLNTLFAFGGIYAAGTFGMGTAEVIQLGIALNVTGGLGAAAFGWIDDWIGPKPTILIALFAMMALGGGILLVQDRTAFWLLVLPMGAFMGPAQAASRSLMAHMAPAAQRSEYFGLFALSGRATAFAGPALLGWVTMSTASQRAGMATILLFLAIGTAILLGVKAPPRALAPEAG